MWVQNIIYYEGYMDIEYEKLVGRKIRNLREKQDLTQEQLSAKLQTMGCDITRSALAKIEVGQRHIYLDELKLIKELLNTNYTTLLDET